MIAQEKRVMAIYVDRACPRHWVVRDLEGRFWIVPPVEQAWENREPYDVTEESDLESVPGHYGYMLGLPM